MNDHRIKQEKFKDGAYWIAIGYYVVNTKRQWYWFIKACNGRAKAVSYTLYAKKCLAINDAHAFARKTGLKVRE